MPLRIAEAAQRVICKMSKFFLSTAAVSKPLCWLHRHIDKKNVDPRNVEGVGTLILSLSSSDTLLTCVN